MPASSDMPCGARGDLYHIALERSDNISHEQSEYIAFAQQTYRLTKKERTFRLRKPICSLFLLVIRVWSCPIQHSTSQMRCSHLTVFFKFSAKNITRFLALFPFIKYFPSDTLIFSLKYSIINCKIKKRRFPSSLVLELVTGLVSRAVLYYVNRLFIS